MFNEHYPNWTKNRVNTIKKYISIDFFKNKNLLELGAGYGHNGNEFNKIGCNVTSSEGRNEHIEIGKKLYPNLKFINLDNDKDKINKKYDIILHWGLLYHLNEIENHLKNVCECCDLLLLESEVCDSNDENFYLIQKEGGYDQALNIDGIKPSPKYVEKILKNNNFNFKMIKDPCLNSYYDKYEWFHNYDWDVKNTNKSYSGLRRFWICWKNDFNIDNINLTLNN
jgi:hypothetical protein